MTTERRAADRRISPAIGEHAIQECARLRNALAVSEALLADCRDSLTSAREECARLRAAKQEQQKQEPEQKWRYQFLDRAALDAFLASERIDAAMCDKGE